MYLVAHKQIDFYNMMIKESFNIQMCNVLVISCIQYEDCQLFLQQKGSISRQNESASSIKIIYATIRANTIFIRKRNSNVITLFCKVITVSDFIK